MIAYVILGKFAATHVLFNNLLELHCKSQGVMSACARSAFALTCLPFRLNRTTRIHRCTARSISSWDKTTKMKMQKPEESVKGLPFMSADVSLKLDQYLMSDEIGYKLEQLMELAGMSVAYGAHALYEKSSIAVAVGPGNNGGDGLVAARHLTQLGHSTRVVLPKPSQGRFPHLEKQCIAHAVPILQTSTIPSDVDVILDCVFGFSFRPRGEEGVGGELKQLIQSMTSSEKPIISCDVPSGWHVDKGDIYDSVSVNKPAAVISLTAPKLCMKEPHEKGEIAHLVGGRFIPDKVWQKFELQPIEYSGTDIVRRVA